MIEERKTDEILTSMLARINDKYDTSQNSFIHQALASAAIEIEEANKELIVISNKFDFWKLDGKELDLAVFDRTGILRREALRASGTVTFTGVNGTEIPANTIVIADSLEFKTTVSAVIVNGIAEVEIVALLPGESGNAGSGTIKKLQEHIQGITDINNSAPLVGGRDEESDDSLKERCDLHMKYPPRAGNTYHYEEWISEIPEVYRVKAFRRYQNRSTVRCVIIEDQWDYGTIDIVIGQNTTATVPQYYKPATTTLIDRIEKYLTDNQLVPFDADVLIEPAKAVNFYISFTPTFEDGIEKDWIIKNAHGILTEYFVNRVFGEEVISYAALGARLLNCPGIKDYTDFRIGKSKTAMGTDNIVLNEDEMILLKEILTNEVVI